MIRNALTIVLIIGLCLASSVVAKNYVNWKGEFWLEMPEGWDKVEYREVDRMLATMDTTTEVYKYEAVLAPVESVPFTSGPYVFITFEPGGDMSDAAADSLLRGIAAGYADDIMESPNAARLSDLNPGQPRLNLENRTVQVLSELAFSENSVSKLWMYLKLNHAGLIAFYMYCPIDEFEATKPEFEAMINSLKFDGLKEAAGSESATFTDVRGNDEMPGRPSGGEADEAAEGFAAFKNWIYIIIGIVIVAGIVWYAVIVPRRKKQQENGSD
ncbi:MAG: hypothetical protein R3F48_07365 [Candidatus Zixiibacteriota bacterium]